MESPQNLQISSDIRTRGFDLSAGKTWIYPENYPLRNYQFNIVKSCLYKNTLVCLPTGLGKTFIAAVVMYNFWRWYPRGKVVFLAPTKPLVAQQIFACHNTMGIPGTETIELTGAVGFKQREIAWSEKRVIFATPQVFHNDLCKNFVPSDLIKCVVIDEAHKALGKHSYCECIRILSEKNQTFRVLALSATPGNKIDNVHEVLQNLLIAHVELRDETSLDIIPHINRRKVDIILVPLDSELAKYKDRYIFIMDRHVKILLQYNILRGDTANISKGRVFHILKEYQKKTNKSGNYGQIIKTLNILITMYHAYELMIRDGLRAFHKFYQNHSDKFWLNEELELQTLLEDIKTYLGSFPDAKSLCDGGVIDIPQDLVFGHTKFDKLKELLFQHFKNSEEKLNDTRAIVFVEYRDIVSEVYVLLLQCQPLIRPQMFVGQAGQKQKQQIKALENFRNNHVNVLISTSIGEEGLDVGEVDLIVCFDVSQHSPTRLVQRMGRTGRKRDGHIIILVTDGREHQTLKSTMARRDSLNHKILNTSNISSSLYQNNPRMIPDNFTPECIKMYISIEPKSPVIKYKNGKGKSNRKGNKRQNILKGSINTESQKSGTKFSMMKYLKSKQCREHSKDSSDVLSSDIIQNNDIYNGIKESDVKILSYDNDGLDFLTTWTLWNSEKEENTKNKCEINESYMLEFPSVKNFFNFSVPDVKILDCLITLNDVILTNCDEKKLNNENNSSMKEYVFENTRTGIIDKSIGGESRFEDLLNDSSKSNNSDLSDIEKKKLKDSDARFSCILSIDSNQYADSSVLTTVEAENEINMLQTLKPSKFEDILNESFDDSEINRFGSFGETSTKDISNNDIRIKNSINIVQPVDNIKLKAIEANDNFFSTYQCKRDIKDYETINKDNNTKEFSEFNDQSVISIKQAVTGTAQLNLNSNVSIVINKSEDDIFEDESFLLQIDNLSDFDQKIKSSIKTKSQKNFNKLENLSNEKSIIDTELQLEAYDWDDDFKISVDPVQSYTKFDALEEKQKGDKVITVESNIESYCSDNENWRISIEKAVNVSKNISHTSISKKLANVRKDRNSRLDYTKECFSTQREVKGDRFFTELNDDFVGKLNDTSFNKERESQEKETKYFRKRNCDRKSRRAKNEFICDEAEVTLDDNETDESSVSDEDLGSFISHTQNVYNTTDMYAHYLQTIRSPVKKQNGFLFKPQRMLSSSIEIYSQPVTELLEESYIQDSFCVIGNESKDEIIQNDELSELEQAEQKLKERKRKRNINQRLDPNTKRNKRRNIIIKFSSSSEDETEKLRKEIRDESLMRS